MIDFVADWRAPTPTAAAERAVPVRHELLARLAALEARKLSCWQRGVEQKRKELRLLARTLPAAEDLLAAPRQRLDACAVRLPRALTANAQLHHRDFARTAARLSPRLLSHRLERCREQTAAFGARSRRALIALLDQRAARIERAERLLVAFSYRATLKRGFALVRDGAGRPLRAAAEVAPGNRLDIEFADGRVGAVAEGEARLRPPPVPRTRRRLSGGDPGQGSLF